MVQQLSTQTGREGQVYLVCVWIASRSIVDREREKIREHQREEKFVNIEENILNRVYSFMYRQKVHLFPHAKAR